MVKDINIHTTFEGRSHIFQCPQKEFLDKAAEYFNINDTDILLFEVHKGQKRQISYHEITDLMKVEIICHNASTSATNGQRTLRSYFDSPKNGDMIEQIAERLKNNTPLTGIQRKYFLQYLEEYSKLPTSLKREVDRDEGQPHPEMLHKKVQVNISFCKDEPSQTDFHETKMDRNCMEEKELITQIRHAAEFGSKGEAELNYLMKKSFDYRRVFITMKRPRVSVVKHKYPLLFTTSQVKNEIDRICCLGKQFEFLKNIEKYSDVILSLGKKSDDIVIKVKNALSICDSVRQKKYIKNVGSLLLMPKLMNEPLGFINLSDNNVEDDVYPYIDAGHMELNELFLVNFSSFKIMVEEQLLCEATNLKEAVLCLIAAFFIFNINYPQNCYKTYVVFEKLYLTANDTYEFDEFTDQMIKLIKFKANERSL